MRRLTWLLVVAVVMTSLLIGCSSQTSEQPATFVDYRRGGDMPLDFNKVVVRLDSGQELVADCPFAFEISDQGKARVMVKQNDDGSWVVMSVTSK